MNFLTLADLEAFIKDDALSEISEGDTTLIDKCVDMAIMNIKDMINLRYSTTATFAATGEARHLTIVEKCIDLTLYFIHKRISPHAIPELRRVAYEDAMKWLKDVRDNKTSPEGLPRAEKEDGEIETGSRYGTNPRLTEPW